MKSATAMVFQAPQLVPFLQGPVTKVQEDLEECFLETNGFRAYKVPKLRQTESAVKVFVSWIDSDYKLHLLLSSPLPQSRRKHSLSSRQSKLSLNHRLSNNPLSRCKEQRNSSESNLPP